MKQYFLARLFFVVMLVAPVLNVQAADEGQDGVQVVATVNIYEGKILTQEKNSFTLSFDLMNRIGAQGNIRSAVVLSDTTGAEVHRQSVDEMISLGAKETLSQKVTYVAPDSLSGDFVLALEASNDAGLTFGFVPIGTVKLTALAPTPTIQNTPTLPPFDPAGAVIRNLVFDHDGYAKGGVAQLSYFFMGSGERVKAIEASLTDGAGVLCTEKTERSVDHPELFGRVSLSVTRECRDPLATLTLRDSKGSVLSEHTFSVKTKQALPMRAPGIGGSDISSRQALFTLIGVVPVALLAIMILWRNARKKSIYGKMGLFLLVLGGSLFFGSAAKADTVVVAGWPFQVSLDKSVYTLSPYLDPVWGDYSVHMDPVTSVKNYQGAAHVSSAICANCITVGVTYPSGVYQGFGPGNSFWNASTQTFTAGFGSHVASHTPGTPGNYTMNFRILIKNPDNSTKADVTYGIPYTVAPQTPINGVCGSADGGSYASAPSSGLCASGSSTLPAGSGPFTWDCVGSWGGTSDSCQAELATCTPNNSACAASTCTTDVCFDGCANISGTKVCSVCVPNNGSCAADTCTTDTCWNGCGYVGGTKDCSVSASLKICEDSCGSGIRRDGNSFSLLLNTSKTLSACLGTGSCSGDDVQVNGTWSGTNNPDNAVTVSPTVNVGQTTLAAVAIGSENITFTRGATTLTTTASVICVLSSDTCDDTSSEAIQTCEGESYTHSYTNNCTGTLESKLCSGTRNCSGYKEVAP